MEKKDSVQHLQNTIREFMQERDWEWAHNPKSLSMSIAIEAAELMEIFQWRSSEDRADAFDPAVKEHIGEEIADVVIYCISMANHFGMSLEEIILNKMKKNAAKYPAEPNASSRK